MAERPRIVVLVGLPGSGKSTYVAGRPALSTDELRGLIADDPTDQTIHWRVFSSLRFLLRHRIALRRPVTYIDATHLTRGERKPYLRLGQLLDCEVEAVFFDVPLEVCRARNRARQRVVPDEALERMAARLIPPTVEEGFSRVTVVRG